MTAPDWVFARVFNDSGVHIADVQSPFESILKGVFAWLTNATSPDAAKMQSLYIPAHCNYEEDRIAFSSINPAYRAAQLKHIRHDFTSLSKTVTVHHTIEKADDLLGFVKTDRNHPEAPELYFTTLALQMMSLSTTDMERQHLYLAIFIVCFRELAYLLGRWVSSLDDILHYQTDLCLSNRNTGLPTKVPQPALQCQWILARQDIVRTERGSRKG